MEHAAPATPLSERIPVGVLIEHAPAGRQPWSGRRREVLGVICGEAVSAAARGCETVFEDGETHRGLWRGLELCLYKDSAESYWYNLTSEQPSVYVVCREEDDDLVPALVTANHDEAAGYLEADDQVFRVAMPPELHQRLQLYVLQHFRPVERKKRRRSEWRGDEEPR